MEEHPWILLTGIKQREWRKKGKKEHPRYLRGMLLNNCLVISNSVIIRSGANMANGLPMHLNAH